MNPAHFRFAPSGFGRLMQGAGCWALNGSFPDTSDPEASAEGTAAHEVAFGEQMGRVYPLGSLTKNGVAVTREMLEGSAEYRSYVVETTHPHFTQVNWERQIRIPCLNLTDCGGTPDADRFNEETGVLDIFDYKFGHGYVEVFENWQLLGYASGLVELPPMRGKVKKIRMHIIQPRNYSGGGIFRSWTISVEELAKYTARIKARIIEVGDGSGETNTGAECTYCNARHACTALSRACGRAIDYSYMPVPDVLPPHALGLEMSIVDIAIDRLKSRRSGLEAQGLAAIRDGKIVPGWAIKHSDGREVWKAPVNDVIALGELFGANLKKPQEAITPNQARTALKGRLDPAIIATMTDRPKGEPKLVIEDSTIARRVFARASE